MTSLKQITVNHGQTCNVAGEQQSRTMYCIKYFKLMLTIY